MLLQCVFSSVESQRSQSDYMCVSQGFIVIELKLSYEPSALLRWRTLVSEDFPTRIGRRMHWILVLESGKVHAARI